MGGYITQAAPTNFHQFWTRKTLAKGETAEAYKEVTAAEKAKLEDSDAAWQEPPQAFIDQWNEACTVRDITGVTAHGRYNEETGYFELNGLADITYGQALLILHADFPRESTGALYYTRCVGYKQFATVRTNIPPRKKLSTWEQSFFGQRIEVINLGHIPQPNCKPYACPSLRRIMGETEVTGGYISGCGALEEANVRATKACSFSMVDSSRLSLGSVEFFARESAAGSTLVVHPNVYAKLTGDISNAAAAALPAEELAQWQSAAATAAERGITLAMA